MANGELRVSESSIQHRVSNIESHALRLTPHVLRFAFYVLLAFLAAAPLWGPGMVNTRGGGDSPFLLQRTLDMAESLQHGIFPVRWMAHAAYDLGYPFFNHYAALPYYLSGGLTALGIGPLVAIQATQTFGFVLAALTMALWAERVFKSWVAALVAVAAYTFAPFHLVNVYVRGDSLSEFYAFVWYPFILWTLDRIAERSTRGRIVAASLAYGALILTHNTSALVFSPFALLYAVMRITNYESANERISKLLDLKSKIKNLKFLIAPFVLGFLLTAWFWLPAIAETEYGQMGPEFTAGYFHYSNHFRGLDLVQRTFAFNYSVAPRAEDAGPFAMGLVQAALALAGVVSLLANGKWQMANGRATNPQSPIPPYLPSTVYRLLALLPHPLHLHDHPALQATVGSPTAVGDHAIPVALSFCAGALHCDGDGSDGRSQNLQISESQNLCRDRAVWPVDRGGVSGIAP